MQRIVVVLPAPFGPRKPVTLPGFNAEGQVVDGDFRAVSFREAPYLDHGKSILSGEPVNLGLPRPCQAPSRIRINGFVGRSQVCSGRAEPARHPR